MYRFITHLLSIASICFRLFQLRVSSIDFESNREQTNNERPLECTERLFRQREPRALSPKPSNPDDTTTTTTTTTTSTTTTTNDDNNNHNKHTNNNSNDNDNGNNNSNSQSPEPQPSPARREQVCCRACGAPYDKHIVMITV